jgi:hypothetical protein
VKHLTIGVVILLSCAGGTSVDAQEVASSFEQLAVLVKPGDKVIVVDVAGRETKGRIGTLSPDALILMTSAGSRQLDKLEVAAITQRRDDSLKNGAIIGAVAGVAYYVTGLALLAGIDDGEVIVPTAIAGGVLFAGLGAAAGVGIDALISGRQVIYQTPAPRSRASVSPVFSHGRRGAAVTVRF